MAPKIEPKPCLCLFISLDFPHSFLSLVSVDINCTVCIPFRSRQHANSYFDFCYIHIFFEKPITKQTAIIPTTFQNSCITERKTFCIAFRNKQTHNAKEHNVHTRTQTLPSINAFLIKMLIRRATMNR